MPAHTELYLIRHADVAGSRKSNVFGECDFAEPITRRGHERSQLIGQRLGELGIQPTHVYSSPAARCQDTARATLHTMGLDDAPLYIGPQLGPRKYGNWNRRRREDVITSDITRRQKLEGPYFRPPGDSESDMDIFTRVSQQLEELRDDEREAVILAFTHRTFIRPALQLLNGPNPPIGYGSIIHLTATPGWEYVDYTEIRFP